MESSDWALVSFSKNGDGWISIGVFVTQRGSIPATPVADGTVSGTFPSGEASIYGYGRRIDLPAVLVTNGVTRGRISEILRTSHYVEHGDRFW